MRSAATEHPVPDCAIAGGIEIRWGVLSAIALIPPVDFTHRPLPPLSWSSVPGKRTPDFLSRQKFLTSCGYKVSGFGCSREHWVKRIA